MPFIFFAHVSTLAPLMWCLADAIHFTKEGMDFELESAETHDRIALAALRSPKPEFVRKMLAFENNVVEPFLPLADALKELGPSNKSNAKVAFLFLAKTNLPWEHLWHHFFQDAKNGSYSIYVHRAALKDDAERKAHELPLSNYGAIEVPWVKTAWCALFGVEVASLYAAMQDPDNVQFVFVSDSTVPLKPFNYVHRELASNSPTTSKICLASPQPKNDNARSCYFRDFLRKVNPRAMKHHQWAVFNRPHAKLIVKYAKEALNIYEDVWLKAAPDLKRGAEGCSDEAVPLIALLHALQVEDKSTGMAWHGMAVRCCMVDLN